MHDNFFETSVVICATSYYEDYNDLAFKVFNEGNFVICKLVLSETKKIYKRREGMYKLILRNNWAIEKPIGQAIDYFINKQDIKNDYDKGVIKDCFKNILKELKLTEDAIPSKEEIEEFQLKVNEVFNHVKNRLTTFVLSFDDYSFRINHTIRNYKAKKDQKLFKKFCKKIRAKQREQNDIQILTNATTFAYETDWDLDFISKDHLHLNNSSKFYEVIASHFDLTLEQEHKLLIKPLSYLSY